MTLRLLTYPYGSVRARTLATSLLSAEQVDQLLGSASLAQAELLLEQWLGIPRGSGERGGYERFFYFAAEVVRALPAVARPFLTAYLRRGEVENLKRLCRSILTSRDLSGGHDPLPAWPPPLLPTGLASARNLGEVAAGLPHGVLRDMVSKAEEFPPSERLFHLETALESWYWAEVLEQARNLPGFDRRGALALLTLRVDIDRLRVVARGLLAELPAETILSALPPYGTLFPWRRLKRALSSADPATAIARLGHPALTDPFASGGEVTLLRRLRRQLQKTLRSAPFNLSVPFSAILLTELEMRDIATLLGALRLGVSAAEAAPFLCCRGG